jgi:hypothetical protein
VQKVHFTLGYDLVLREIPGTPRFNFHERRDVLDSLDQFIERDRWVIGQALAAQNIIVTVQFGVFSLTGTFEVKGEDLEGFAHLVA